MTQIKDFIKRNSQRDKTLTKKGKLLVKILDFFDENHCKNSIKEL